MSILFAESDGERCERLAAEIDSISKHNEQLRECIAFASVLIRNIGTTDANSTDNIRRAEKWLTMAGKLLAKTYD